MELLTMSVLTLLALYLIYDEPFKLPEIVKKNKKLSYGLIIGFYLYYYQNNMEEEGFNTNNLKFSKEDTRNLIIVIISLGVLFILYSSKPSRKLLLGLLKFLFYPFIWAFRKIWEKIRGKSND